MGAGATEAGMVGMVAATTEVGPVGMLAGTTGGTTGTRTGANAPTPPSRLKLATAARPRSQAVALAFS